MNIALSNCLNVNVVQFWLAFGKLPHNQNWILGKLILIKSHHPWLQLLQLFSTQWVSYLYQEIFQRGKKSNLWKHLREADGKDNNMHVRSMCIYNIIHQHSIANDQNIKKGEENLPMKHQTPYILTIHVKDKYNGGK